MKLTDFYAWLNSYHGQLTFFAQIALIVFGIGLLNFIAHRILSKSHKNLKHTTRLWDDSLLAAIKIPIHGVILLLGFAIIIEIVKDAIGEKHFVFEYVPLLKKIVIVYLFSAFGLKFIQKTESNLFHAKADEENFDRTSAIAIGKLARILVFFIAGLMLLQALQVNISGLLAFGGIGGAIIGFSAKDLLANFFGAMIIFMDRPFSVGEWIRSPDRNIEGFVEYIGWRLTRIRTFERRPLYVPNSIFNTIIIENPGRMTNRRLKEIVGIRYNDHAKAGAITKAIEAMLQSEPDVDQNLTVRSTIVQFGPSSIDICIYCFTKTRAWGEFLKTKEAILLKVMNIILEHGAEVAFPTTTIYLEQAPESG